MCLEFRLIRFQHTNFAPAMKEQSDRTHPQDKHEQYDENLLRVHNQLRPWKTTIIFNKCSNSNSRVIKTKI